MKKIVTSLFLIAMATTSFAQSTIANGAICPNITIKDTKGIDHKLYDYCNAGKYVLIDFYAYWCGPCMATAPIIEDFYKKYGCNTSNVIVLGNECDAAGTLSTLQGFETSAGLSPDSYPTTYGTIGGSGNGTTYGIGAYPTIILVGPDKKMIKNDVWPISNVASIEAAFPTGVSLVAKACAPTSLAQIDDQTISVQLSPNPVSNTLTVQSESILDIIIYNQVGSKVLSVNTLHKVDKKTLDVSTLSQGIYLAEVHTSKGKQVVKFTK